MFVGSQGGQCSWGRVGAGLSAGIGDTTWGQEHRALEATVKASGFSSEGNVKLVEVLSYSLM